MEQSIETDRYVTRPQAGEMLSMSPNYLAKIACLRRGPRFTKFGDGIRSPVRYAVRDLLAWARDPASHEREVWGSTAAKRNARRQKAGR